MDCVSLASASRAPAARVIEADRHGVLSAPFEPRMPAEDLSALTIAALNERGREPGSVVVRAGVPLQLLAIVHDVEREPTWCEAWVAEAWCGVFAEAVCRALNELAVPLLGTVHGRLPRARAVELLAQAAADAQPGWPGALWVDDPDPTVVARLQAALARAGKT